MARVTELSVHGFKAVEEAEVQPGGVNLVVGRNNVGKTSLLEGLHLALDPSSISRFDGNLDKVVREGAEKATVSIGISGDSKSTNRAVTVERQGQQEAHDMFRADVEDEIRRLANTADGDTAEIVAGAPQRAITELKHREHYSDVKRYSSTLITNSRNEYLSPEYLGVVEGVSKSLVPDEVSNQAERRELENFRDAPPDPLTTVRFVTDPGFRDIVPESESDGAAIRRSRIEDFLIDNAILDGLVDFSFDRLVFEDGDEREEVPYDFMGSGFKTLVGILWELYDQDADTEVMIIEEPAVHMHPGYVNEFTQQLLQVARQEDVQLFVTTHREDLIESFFAPPTERAHGDYLREEFQVIQLTELLTKQLDYEQAETELDELNTDLRGI